jgi:nitrite reductase (NADH) large subunit
MSESLIVVGNGMAAARFAAELIERAPGRYHLTIIGNEPGPAYNRVLLSSLLAGEIDETTLTLKPQCWWSERGIAVICGEAVISIDRTERAVTLANGTRIAFSKLVLATGSAPIRLPTPGMSLPGVLTFRDLADVEAMQAALRPGFRAVVIGGGLLGIEAAYGLAKAGADVTLVHLMDRLMERQLDAPAAALVRRAIEAKGVKVLLSADTARVRGLEQAEALELNDGRVLPADLVVCAVGIRPQTRLARDAGLAVDRGILVDDHLATSDPGIFALGECAEHRARVYGLVEPAYEQARILAQRLAGDDDAAYRGSTLATNLKVSGVNVFSAGDFMEGPSDDVLTFEDEGAHTYKKLVVRKGRLMGAVLVGDTADALWYLDLIRTGADIGPVRDALAFGPALTLPQAA